MEESLGVDEQLHAWVEGQLVPYRVPVGQALFDTEQVAGRVASTLSHGDVLAAAVLAHFWMRKVSGLTVQHFPAVGQKRAFDTAMRTLDGAITLARSQQNEAVGAFVGLVDAYAAINASGRGEPANVVVERARAEVCAAEGERAGARATFNLGFVMLTVCIWLVPIGHEIESDALFLFGFLGVLGGIALAVSGLAKSGAAKRKLSEANERLQQAEAFAERVSAFANDPRRGGYMLTVWRQHPYLATVAPPTEQQVKSAGPSQVQVYVDRHVVERQVVKVRCRYCSALTPSDATHCETCGGVL